MNIIGKIIAVIAFVLIILILVNFRTIIPYFNSLAFGGGASSPFQIGASYIDQANKLSPYNAMTGGTAAAQSGGITYGSYLAAQQQAGQQTGYTKNKNQGKITVQKIGSILSLTTEYVLVNSSDPDIHIWLTNKSTVSDTTKFIDFGSTRSGSFQSYMVDLGPTNISMTEYKHVMIINTKTLEIYGQAVLGK